MKNHRKLFFPLVLLIILSLTTQAQTNVSGGIYSNTTWTLANSPYIVTDTVVVFPGVTLTIEPGVIVKFDSAVQLEIRQGQLIAQGTASDTITFTKNISSKYSGIIFNNVNSCSFNYINSSWIYISCAISSVIKNSRFNNCELAIGANILTMDSCIFYDNGIGINCGNSTITNCTFSDDTTGVNASGANLNMDNCSFIHNSTGAAAGTGTISHCNFLNNHNIGLSGGSTVKNSTFNNNYIGDYATTFIDSCVFKNNKHYGCALATIDNSEIDSNSIGVMYFYKIYNCIITNNDTGIYGTGYDATYNIIENNSIGIYLEHSDSAISCNRICNNTLFDVYYVEANNFSMANNYWCTTDSNIVETHIYDGYDNINYGLINFMPIDTLQCYLVTDILVSHTPNFSFDIYPNPANDHLTLKLPESSTAEDLRIFNILGEEKYSSLIKDQKTDINVSHLSEGVYIIEVSSGNKIIRQKFIKQ